MFDVPPKSFVLRAIAVVAAVGICTLVLFAVRPWPETDMAFRPMSERAARVQSEPFTAPAESQPLPKPESNEGTQPAITEVAKAEPVKEEPQKVAEVPAASPSPQTAEKAPEPAPAAPSAAQAQAAPSPASEKVAALAVEADDDPVTTAAMPNSARLSKAEADEALKPLLTYTIPDSELAALKEFVRLTHREEHSAAKPHLNKIKDPAARKLALWYSYKSGGSDADAEEIIAFRADNPLWPNRDALIDRAENALFWRESDPRKVVAFFRDKRPATAVGRAALGGALISSGRAEEGRRLLRQAWREAALTPSIENRLKEKYGSELRPADHKARIDWLLVQDNKAHMNAVERLLPLIDKKWEPQVKACIAAVKRAKNASTLISKLDKEAHDHPAVLLIRIQLARRADKDKEAWAMLRSAPTSPDALIEPARWWDERAAQIRAALNEGDAKTAYTIAKYHPQDLEPEDISEAEFLAGWIALRFIEQPKAAREHFAASAAAGGLPFRRARAAYWAGRTEIRLGNHKAATAFFAEGAQFRHTFYGQLSHQMIEPRGAKVALRNYVRPTRREINAFNKLDVMRAIVLAGKADMDGVVPIFLFDLSRNITSAADMILAAEFTQRITRPNIAVRMAKIAMNRGFPVEHYAYPDALPQYKALGKDQDLELALVSALTRQESEFYPGTVSSAGAIGLMQLLPSTAKEVAKTVSVKFEKKKLSSDPSYNVSLGSAFLHQLVRSYDGSYVMTLAAYNAGPGRVRQWVNAFGDPRDSKVDPIDWVERIPITETREYVHKIMESVQLYRARLDKRPTPLRLAQDLHRGRKDQPRFMTQAGN